MRRAVHVGRGGWAALALCLLLTLGFATGCDQGDEEEVQRDASLPVKVQPVSRATIARVLRRTGEIQPFVEVRVFSTIPDRILDLRVDEGDEVRRGQTLAIIKSQGLAAGVAQVAASLESARAQRDKVRDDLRRAEVLLRSNVASPVQVESLRSGLAAAEAQVRSLEAVVEQATDRQRQSTVLAPINGIVGQRFLNRGDLALPQLPIVTLVQIDRVKVVVQATEFDLPHLKPGTTVEVQVAAYGDEVFAGEVFRIAPVIDPMTRHAEVEILLSNEDHRLKPGMLARVTVVLARHHNALVVPLAALLLDDERWPDGSPLYTAYVVQDAKAHRRRLEVGLLEGPRMEVLEGLAEGEVLVVRGQQLLEDGSPVAVAGGDKPPTPPAAAPSPSEAKAPGPTPTSAPTSAPAAASGAKR